MKVFIWFFIFLLFSCEGLPFFSGKEKVSPAPKVDPVSCQADTDCVLVSANCCSCNNGGKSIAIHKSQKESYNRDLEKYCSARENTMCLTVYNCGITYSARCEDSKCITLVKRPQPPH